MAKKTVSVEVSAVTHDLGIALMTSAISLKDSLEDGFQLDKDLPTVLKVLMGLVPHIQNVGQIDDEMKEDPAAFARAIGLSVSEAMKFIKKDDAAV